MKIKELMALKVGETFISTGEGVNNPVAVLILSKDDDKEEISFAWMPTGLWPTIKTMSYEQMVSEVILPGKEKFEQDHLKAVVAKFEENLWPWVKYKFHPNYDENA